MEEDRHRISLALLCMGWNLASELAYLVHTDGEGTGHVSKVERGEV